MSDKKIKLVIFITLLLLLIGIVNATEITDDTNIDNTMENIETTNSHDIKIDNNVDNTQLSNNKFNENYADEKNSFDKSDKKSVKKTSSKYYTTLYTYDRETAEYGSTIKVSGKLFSDDGGVKGQIINISVNDEKYSDKTDVYGYFTINYTIKDYGPHKVVFKYAGNTDYLSSTGTFTFMVKKDTNIYMYSRSGDKKDSTIKVSGKLLSNDIGVKGEKITITVNKKQYTTTTGGYGYFTINHTITTYDDCNVTFKYAGNSNYKPSNNSTVYSVKKPTNLFMYTRNGDLKGTTIKVSGKLQYNGSEGIKGETVTIKVNDKTYTATTGGYGYFTINHIISSYDNLNVTFNYGGSTKYLSSKNTTIYPVKKPTTLYMYERSGDKKGTTIKVSGKLQYNNTGIKGETVTITVNNKNYTATTGGYGYFTINHTITTYDDCNVTFSYKGSSNYLTAKNSTIYTVKKPTNLFMYTRNGDTIGSTIKISGKLQYKDSEGIKGETVTIKVNDKTYTATTGGYGYFTINHIISSYDNLNVTFNYGGSTKYLSSKNTTIYPVKKPTTLYMYERSGDKKGTTIKVSGKLQYNNTGIKGETVTITVNNKNYTATTGGYGYFTINHTITTYDDCKVIFKYLGNSNYLPTSNSTVYTVKKPTSLYIYEKEDVTYGTTTKINGKLTFANRGITGETVKISINNEEFRTTTGENGDFTINYTINSVGNYIIKCTYDGNEKFLATSNSTNFKATKENTTLTINPILDVNYNTNITVSGKLTDSHNNPLKQTNINLIFNGVEKQLKTDNKGVYTFTNQSKKVGSNTITINFSGNEYYLGSDNKVTFKVINKPTKLGYDVFDVEYGEYTNITGYLVDDDWQNLIKTLVTININGKNYSTRTDTEGNFYYQYKTEKTGTNNITISFKGTEYYSPVSTSKTFTVNKKDVGILIDPITTAIQGNMINIYLMLLDYDENPIQNSEMLVKINDERFEVKTDKYGEYILKYTPNKIGRNIIDVTYLGNEYYSKSYATDDFIVVKPYNITLSISKEYQETLVGSDSFQTWYQTHYGQSDPGVYLYLSNIHGEDMGSISENLVINATFYFKDSKGNVITRQCTDGNGMHMYHNLISGYTPFKVVATYFKMTSYEIGLWENGYEYDILSGEWYDPDRYYY